MELISRYKRTEDSLLKLRRRFGAVGGEPVAIAAALTDFLAITYGLVRDGPTTSGFSSRRVAAARPARVGLGSPLPVRPAHGLIVRVQNATRREPVDPRLRDSIRRRPLHPVFSKCFTGRDPEFRVCSHRSQLSLCSRYERDGTMSTRHAPIEGPCAST